MNQKPQMNVNIDIKNTLIQSDQKPLPKLNKFCRGCVTIDSVVHF